MNSERSTLRRWCDWAGGLALSLFAAAAAAQPAADIDLKMFDKAEVDLSRGCSVALWQAGRDPAANQFAYLFVELMTGANNVRQPARIKIGNQAITLRRVATGGRNNGYDLFEYQLYKMPGETDYVVLDLKIGPLEGEAVDVESGTMSVIMRGRTVFRASVKGGAGCATPAAPPPPAMPVAKSAAPPSPVAGLHKYTVRPADVPRALLLAAQKKFNCDMETMKRGITGFGLSEEAAIWDIPCQTFAYQGNSIFASVYTLDPARNFSFLGFQEPKGNPRTSEPGTLINPTWDAASRTVTSVALGRGAGDCGVLERHRVNAEGQFVLIEYREKKNCDGKETRPEDYPLVFRLR